MQPAVLCASRLGRRCGGLRKIADTESSDKSRIYDWSCVCSAWLYVWVREREINSPDCDFH